MNRGKLVIVFIFGLSTAMGVYAWWFHYQQGKRCLQLWGSETATRIRFAPRVEAMVLGDADPSADAGTLTIGGRSVAIRQRARIEEVPGLLHARYALLEDASFQWDAALADQPATWQYAMRFEDDDGAVVLLFDPAAGWVRDLDSGREGRLRPKLVQSYQTRIPQWIEAASR